MRVVAMINKLAGYGITDDYSNINNEVIALEPTEIGSSGIYYPVQLPFYYYDNNKIELISIINWCMETFPYEVMGGDTSNRWGNYGRYLWHFKNEDDRNWFLLKWG